MDINKIFSELAQWENIEKEAAEMIDGLKDQIKAIMLSGNVQTLTGSEHSATYSAVKSSRIDTVALKKAYPDIAKEYTKTTETMRFVFK